VDSARTLDLGSPNPEALRVAHLRQIREDLHDVGGVEAESALTWLDFSEQERRKVLDVVNLFRDRNTVDELGVGVVRDSFAELLFPGTSTLHTRAKYALFIPWIYREIERSPTKSQDPWPQARNAELRLIDQLADSEDGRSAIGIDARATLKTFASTIYWSALGRWQIRAYPQSQDQYHRWVRAGGARAGSPPTDDDSEDFALGGWHARLPDPPERFPRSASFRLNADQSEYVAERIVMAAPSSLLAFLLDRRIDVGDVESPWLLPGGLGLPSELADQLHHAGCFSLAINGAPLLYNLMLSELRPDKRESIEDFRGRLSDWSREIDDRAKELGAWDRKGDFWEIVESTGARPTPPTRRFIENWLDLTIDGDPESVANDKRARQLISNQERRVKGGRARLHSQAALALWGGDTGTGRLSYRWSNVQQIVGDVVQGFQATDA
jgi:hypothetical protein